jgi:hypothetical protein
MTIEVLDPRLSAEGEAVRPAPALRSLEGTVVGLLDNAKIGTERFYDFVAEILRSEHGVRELIRRRKPDTTRPAPKEMLAELSGADAVISGVGD